ncbi:hypothetical protein GCM10007094_23570 [Pseudovibrio japonicus]|uniref:Uncharacterized protein n=1 Tax=Pseudovibrio japonicus TaxID=366534 RepID=A0ABQ3ED72_9HYPH|nr:hypothetical protein GCM10007094_23570 [Pseudovibrio japonicus]
MIILNSNYAFGIEWLKMKEKFITDVMTLTGRTEERAERLVQLIERLARSSIEYSPEDYFREWKRRYCAGWSHSRLRHIEISFHRDPKQFRTALQNSFTPAAS